MRPPDPRPLEAIILDDGPPTRPNSSWRTWLLAITAFAAFLACSGVGLWGLATLRQIGRSRDVSGDSLHYQWETPEQRLANIAAAMNAETVGCSPNELREITRLFGRVVEALSAGDQDAFRDLVDRKVFAQRASLHPLAMKAESFDRLGLEEQLEWDLEGPTGWSRFRVVHVVWGPKRDEAIVYAVFADSHATTTPFRWWLRRSGRTWLVCDWEDLDYGYPHAERWAIQQVIGEDANASNYWEVSPSPHRAYEAVDRGDLAAARRELKDQREKRLPEIAHDLVWLEMAFAWRLAGDPDEALATLDRVKRPDWNAGVEYLKALVYEEADESDRALAAAQRYRALAGCHPEVLQIEAWALEAAGRQPEAADCWWQLVRLLPEKEPAMVEFGRLANDDKRPKLVAALSKARRPADLALTVGQTASRNLDEATSRQILEWLREQPAGKLNALLLAAANCEREADYAQAAEHYRAALKLAKRPNDTRQIQSSLLQALIADDRLLAAYEELPDPRHTFEQVTAGIEDDEALVSLEELPPLVAAHAQREPEDPRLHFMQALLLSRDRKFAEATQALIRGEKLATEDELLHSMRAFRAECLYRQGKIDEAIQVNEDDSLATLQKLAWLGRFDEDWERHDQLLASFRQRHGDDPWVAYFRALRKQDQGQTAEALALLPQVNEDDDTLKVMVDRLRVVLLKESKNLGQAYAQGGEPKEAFTSLVQQLENSRDWEGILSLTQIHTAVAPSDPAAIYYASLARWHQQDYAALVAELTPWPTKRLEGADAGWSTQLSEWLVRSRLRLGQIKEARAAAVVAQAELGEHLPLLLVEQHAGDAKAVRTLLAHGPLAQSVFQWELMEDPELAGLLDDTALADLRQSHPLELPLGSSDSQTSLVLLLSEPSDWQRITECARRAAGESTEIRTVEPFPRDPTRRTAIIQLTGGAIALTSADRPYCDPSAFRDQIPPDHASRAAVEQHSGWVAIDAFVAADSPDRSIERLSQQVVAALLSEAIPLGEGDPVIYLNRAASGSNFLLKADDAVRKQLAEGVLVGNLTELKKESIWLSESVPEPAEPSNWQARQKELQMLAKSARVENGAGYGRVRVPLRRGHAHEEIWLKVVRSRRDREGRETLIAEFEMDSAVWPKLRAGTRLKVAWYQVLDLEPSP